MSTKSVTVRIRGPELESSLKPSLAVLCEKLQPSEEASFESELSGSASPLFETQLSDDRVRQLCSFETLAQVERWLAKELTSMDELVDYFLLADQLGLALRQCQVLLANNFVDKSPAELREIWSLPDDLSEARLRDLLRQLEELPKGWVD
jgi:hypothetical protein